MADVNFAAIASALATLFEDRITSQINRSTVLMQLCPVGNGQGKNLSWNARFGSAVGAPIADGADVSVFNNDEKVPANLEYGTYSEAFAVTGKALAAAAATGNPAELENLFEDELGDAIERLAKGIGLHVWTGDGSTDQIHGLLAAPGAITDTGVYAGIDRAVRSAWAGNVDANAGTPRALTVALMRAMRTEIYEASGLGVDLIVTTPQLHDKYGELLEDKRRSFEDVVLRGRKITLDAGYNALRFDDIPVVKDVDCPEGTMVFLNTRLMKIAQLPDGSSAVNGGRGEVGLRGTEEEQFGEPMGKLTARINPLGPRGDKFAFQLINYPQLQVKRPNAFGVIEDLDASL